VIDDRTVRKHTRTALVVTVLGALALAGAGCSSNPSSSGTTTTKATSTSAAASGTSHLSLTNADNNQTMKVTPSAVVTVMLPYTQSSSLSWQRITGGAGFLPIGQTTFHAATAAAPVPMQELDFKLTDRKTPFTLVIVYAPPEKPELATKRFTVTLDPTS
jgi:hypothetical protein